jgi:hypothetical protein
MLRLAFTRVGLYASIYGNTFFNIFVPMYGTVNFCLCLTVKSSRGTSSSTIIGVFTSIVVAFGLVLMFAFFYHRRKLRAAKEEMDNFIKRFNLGDPEALVIPFAHFDNYHLTYTNPGGFQMF